MSKTRLPKAVTNKSENISSSSSIIARAGQIMAIFITIGVIGMLSSMLVSESLSGDAAQINRAGALRMQAIRISRAIVTKPSNDKTVTLEMENFQKRLNNLFHGGVSNALDDEDVKFQYQFVLSHWQTLKEKKYETNTQTFDDFVLEIDKLVTFLQFGSEKKLSLLRLIQGLSLFTLTIISFFVLYNLHRTVVVPLKQLVTVAEHAAKGDFSIKATNGSDNELGVLARTINHMSDELALTYHDFELMVDTKTKALTHSNRSLQVLYKAANNLAVGDYRQTDEQIIKELESALGLGKITIDYITTDVNKLSINISEPESAEQLICFEQVLFPLDKSNQQYGCIKWHIPKQEKPRQWQTKMLQAMAYILATAIELERKRNSENRLIIVEERAVIARELHDSLAQSLSYLKVQMSLLTRKIDKEVAQENIDETIVDIKQGINDAYRQLRELLTTFRLKLDDPSLVNALQGTVVEFAEKCQHEVKLDFQLEDNSLTPNQEIHVLQIIREALSNVQRHAKANFAAVSLILKNDKCHIEIWDDGIGIKNLSHEHGHFGLGIMQERAKSLNTTLTVKARQPRGTIISFKF